jgi:signal transduction histidine kinase
VERTSPNGGLASFIRNNADCIVREWTDFARSQVPASEHMSALALEDHIRMLLEFVTADLETSQTQQERLQKSQGLVDHVLGAADSAAETHADLRIRDGFNLVQVIAEFRALRASIVELWAKSRGQDFDSAAFAEVTRFHESIDQLLAESVARYSRGVDRRKNLFLAVIGHDLANPISAAAGGAGLLTKGGNLNDHQRELTSRISASMFRARALLGDLSDLTRMQFGFELPIKRTETDMGLLAREIVDEVRTIFPSRSVDLKVAGNTQGCWDRKRLGQVLSNLVSNAMSHGNPDCAVTVEVRGDAGAVELSVHNMGEPIPREIQGQIFGALVRGGPADSQHLGLGLYVARKIVDAHGGRLDLRSSAEDGTLFTAQLPREP